LPICGGWLQILNGLLAGTTFGTGKSRQGNEFTVRGRRHHCHRRISKGEEKNTVCGHVIRKKMKTWPQKKQSAGLFCHGLPGGRAGAAFDHALVIPMGSTLSAIWFHSICLFAFFIFFCFSVFVLFLFFALSSFSFFQNELTLRRL
jgi:hypothetical protein